MKKGTCNIVIGGEAGQGLVTVGQMISKILVRSGYHIVVTQSYQSRIRGGHNTFAVRVAPRFLEAPAEAIDILVALNGETVELHRKGLAPGGLIVADEAFGVADDACLKVPFETLAGDERFVNTAALGILCALLGLEREPAGKMLDEFFGVKHPEMMEGNKAALARSFEWTGARPEKLRKLPFAEGGGGKVMLNGNEAIALGAVSAGVRFCAFYPMTPATSIPLTLIGMAERMGLVVEQAEDEIAAVNMAIGASFAGAPAMVATSGGGFALMVEGVSLAGMTETPLVMVVAQRPGPATGLPTRTEQADLEFVLHAGHGEFPRAVFAPGTVDECFHLTSKAFDLAERYQGPMFVLTDQFLADSYRAVQPFDVGGLDQVRPGAGSAPIEAPYRRHAITESGISPRLIPGAYEHLVVTDSDEHTEDGHLTEDLEVRTRQVEKRLAKGIGITGEMLQPEHGGPDAPELLLVSWGSTLGSVREAASLLRAGGREVSTLHFRQVWPLVPDQFLGRLTGAGRVVCVEGNATGQLASLIRRETGFLIEERVNRYDGLPITPEYIVKRIS
ncbi:MAG: 2-oxoacid:acceptor oxidoreductase subunit alpha [bacterium]|nr:MAG: 2-oxoacid:acceptor oxidoreductase subunit alpha [bacterium]